MILANFDLQVTLMLPSKFGVNWPFGSGEAKNRLSRWLPWRPSLISDRHDFELFLIYKSPRCFLASLESTGFLFQEKKRKIDFSSWQPSWIGRILAIFDLQVTPMLPTKYQVNWPRGVGGVGF